jgi:TRAP-type C4-dicarboxylate transport system substrate-binding protein
MNNTTLQQDLINLFDTLSSEEQDNLLDLLKQRRIEQRRKEIAENAEKTREAIKNGTAFCGDFAELKEWLLAE